MTLADHPTLSAIARLWPSATVTRRPGRSPALLVLPHLRSPRMLVPTGTPGADRMLRRFSRSRGQRMAQGVLARGVRTGLVDHLPVARVLTGPGETIEDHLRRHLPDATATGVLLGPPRANGKPVLQVFGAGGRCLAFGKVGHTSATAELVRREVGVLADSRLHDLSRVRVPVVIDAGAWGGMDVLLTQVMPAAQSGTHTWALPVDAVREISESVPVEWSPAGDSAYWAGLRLRLRALDWAPADRLTALADRLAGSVEPTTLGFGRWHGDFSPWNCGAHLGALEVWDWEQSAVGVPLGLDAVHFVTQRALLDESDAAETVRRIRSVAFPVLREWYGAEDAPEPAVTTALYLLEIMHRYAQQSGSAPSPTLAARLARLEAVTDLVASELRTSSFQEGLMRLPTIVGERDPILRAGRRTFAAIVGMALVGAVVAGAWALTRPVQYSSTIALELTSVTPVVDLNSSGPRLTPVTQDTDAQIMVADPVVDAVVATVGGDPESVRQALHVRARPVSRVLELTYTTDQSPDAAREGVTSAAEAYLDLRDKLIILPIRDYLSRVVSSTTEVQRESWPDGDYVTRGQLALENRLERAQAYDIRLPAAGDVVAAPTDPRGKRGTVDVIVMSGAVVGALIGLGLGLLLERRARRRRSPAGPSQRPGLVRVPA